MTRLDKIRRETDLADLDGMVWHWRNRPDETGGPTTEEHEQAVALRRAELLAGRK